VPELVEFPRHGTPDESRGSITGITGGIVKRNFDNEEDLIQCLKETAIKIYR
jgi:hypothetical protein